MTQFKIGSVYRFKGGRVAEIRAPKENNFSSRLKFVGAMGEMFEPGTDFRYSYVDLALGRHPHDLENGDWQLVPGELHNFNGQWLPVEEKAEQPMAPYFAEALEDFDAAIDKLLTKQVKAYRRLAEIADPNAAMLARDAANYVARPAAPVVIQEPAKTSHSPIAGLTVVAAVDHRLGSAFR